MNENILDDIFNIVKSEKLINCLRLCGFKNMFDFINFDEKSIDNVEKYVRLKCTSMAVESRSIYLDDFDILTPHDFMISPGIRNRLIKAAKAIENRAQMIQPAVSSIIKNCSQIPQISSITSYSCESSTMKPFTSTSFNDNYQNNYQAIDYNNCLINQNIKSESDYVTSERNFSDDDKLSDIPIITIDLSHKGLTSLDGSDNNIVEDGNALVDNNFAGISDSNINKFLLNKSNGNHVDKEKIYLSDNVKSLNDGNNLSISQNCVNKDDLFKTINEKSIFTNLNTNMSLNESKDHKTSFNEISNVTKEINLNRDHKKEINDNKNIKSNVISVKENVHEHNSMVNTTSFDVIKVVNEIISNEKHNESVNHNSPSNYHSDKSVSFGVLNKTSSCGTISNKRIDEMNDLINRNNKPDDETLFPIKDNISNDKYSTKEIRNEESSKSSQSPIKDKSKITLEGGSSDKENNSNSSLIMNILMSKDEKLLSEKDNSSSKDIKPSQSIFEDIKTTLARAQHQKSTSDISGVRSSTIIINNIAIDMNSYYDDMANHLNTTFPHLKLVPKIDFELEFQIDNNNLQESFGYYICNLCSKRKIIFKFSEHMSIIYDNVKQHVKRDSEERLRNLEATPAVVETVVESMKRTLASDVSHNNHSVNKIFRKD